MKIKGLFIFLIFTIILTIPVIFLHNSNSSMQAETSDFQKNDDLIRVGISTNDFSQLEYNEVDISANGKFEITDKSSGSLIAKSEGKNIFSISIQNGTFKISSSDRTIAEKITGPIGIKSAEDYPIQIVGLTRKGKPAYYRGEIEIIKAPGKNKLSVVNILPMKDYLKGVVPNELPVSFGLEALKAQAVAARNYAIRPRVKSYQQFDICDSVQCQVYFGYNTEHPLSNQAINETNGIVALYDGDVILALYSSTAGGYTENYENAFSEPGTEIFPARPLPYLKGKPDNPDTPVLNNEDAARQFYTSTPPGFDINSSYYRWTRNWTKGDLESILNRNLSKYSNSELIYPKFEKGSTIGNLLRVDVLSRGVSGKAIAVQITGSNGCWIVKKELLIRRIFEESGKILPSANIILNNLVDNDNNLVKVEAIGGGLGHGVGLSQYGAGYMSKNGYTFDEILKHYYDNIALGTTPVLLISDYTFDPVKQEFFSPNGQAELVLDNKEKFSNFKISINSNEITIPQEELAKEKLRINLDKYVKKGSNTVIYYPPCGEQEGKSIKAWIEVFKTQNDR